MCCKSWINDALIIFTRNSRILSHIFPSMSNLKKKYRSQSKDDIIICICSFKFGNRG